MEIQYTCTFWGCEKQTAKEFLANAIANGYDGVEINFPDDAEFVAEFISELAHLRQTTHPNFIFIAQQVLPNRKETVKVYTQRMTERLAFLTALKPDYINSHTGKDYYSFGENCTIIDAAEQLAKSAQIPIWHEIHRGRFSFHLKTLLDYLELFPKLKLIADFSHFCVVSESDLHDQHELLTQLYPHIQHIHARIGFEQSPQVNNPFAPEWKSYLERYTTWWNELLEVQKKLHKHRLSITPEFGPFPYMPQEPFTQKPLANQWETNLQMKNYLQKNLLTNG
jgi:hypothetical protein